MLDWLWGKPAEKPDYLSAKVLFTEEERRQLQSLFQQVTAEPDASGLHNIQRITSLPSDALEVLGRSLLAVVKQGEDTFDFQRYLVAKAVCEKRGEEASREFCFQVLAGGPQGAAKDSVDSTRLVRVLLACAKAIGLRGEDPRWATAVAAGALKQQNGGSSAMMMGGSGQGGAHATGPMTLEGYGKWSTRLPALHQVLSCLLSTPPPAPPPAATLSSQNPLVTPAAATADSNNSPAPKWSHIMPQMVVGPQYNREQLLLQPQWAWLLSSRLPPDQRQEWRLLFNSFRDGGSFTTFIGKAAEQAPTLVLVRDTQGGLFGGYAPQAWRKQGSFYGEFATFIFSLEPETLVYPATGINENFQWCGVHFKELPNGIGFGGQPGNFALYVDSSMEGGISRPSATFANAPLSHSGQNFQVECVECWLLQPPEDEEVLQGAGKAGPSIRDRNKEDQNLLELAGVNVRHGDGRVDHPDE